MTDAGPSRTFLLIRWIHEAYNPPPLETLGFSSRIYRSILVTILLVTGCVVGAFLMAGLLWLL